MTDIDLDEIEARASAATEGPWDAYVVPDERNRRGYVAVGAGDTEMQVVRYEGGHFDAAFIAAAREAVPALIARVRELEAQRDAVLVLHSQEPWIDADQFGNDQVRGVYCDECREAWPCATVRALTEGERR